MLTKSDVHAFLKDLGIKSTDTVLIHTSMKAIGEVEGGCDGLIDGFTSYLTDGLFIVPTHTWANVGKDNPVYDVRTTTPCIGAMPTVAAFRADGIRSLHPTHSVAAFGKRAAEFVKGEENATSPCFIGGVWTRLFDEDAKILLLGVNITKLTYLHAVDEIIDVPNRLSDPMDLTIIDYEGKEHKISYRKHHHPTSQFYVNYQKAFDSCGILSYSKLGEAKVTALSARKVTELVKKIWAATDYDICSCYKDVPEEYYKN